MATSFDNKIKIMSKYYFIYQKDNEMLDIMWEIREGLILAYYLNSGVIAYSGFGPKTFRFGINKDWKAFELLHNLDPNHSYESLEEVLLHLENNPHTDETVEKYMEWRANGVDDRESIFHGEEE